MALVPCKGCGNPVDGSAKTCPKCGRGRPTVGNGLKIALALVLVVAIGAFIQKCSTAADEFKANMPAGASLQGAFENSVNQRVVDDSIRQYEIAKRSGTKMDACVHAGFVSAACIQAKDEASYRKWKAIEKADCSKSPQKRHQRALRATRIRSRAPTNDLCEENHRRHERPDTRKTLQKQADQREAQIPSSPPLLTHLPHPSWWGTWGGSPLSPLDELPKWAGVNDLWL